jgi:protoheme IX farnesyltransferase
MKASAQTLEQPAPSMAADWAELAKARLTTLVLFTVGAGFFFASEGPIDWLRLCNVLFGSGLTAAAAAALNQFAERKIDALMHRTRERPLPAGRMQPEEALAVGLMAAVLGLGHLAYFVNGLTSTLAGATLGIYVLVYTPLKRFSTLNTLVGALPGALPPMMGWTAVTGTIGAPAWALFGLLFFWQMPHFYAIAWMYRDDYAKAGLKMLPLHDPTGLRTALESCFYSLCLLAVSLVPFFLGLDGWLYVVGAVLLGGFVLLRACQFAKARTTPAARKLFLSSILYLPLVLILLLVGQRN